MVPNFMDTLELADWLLDKDMPERQGFFSRTINKASCGDEVPYRTVFFDDFSGNELDTSFWLTNFPYPYPYDIIGHDDTHVAFSQDNVSVNNGILKLDLFRSDTTMFFPPGSNQHERKYTGGMIFSNRLTKGPNFEPGCFGNGIYTIRAKLAPHEGAFPSYWFTGWAGEVDMFEFWESPQGELLATLHQWALKEQGDHYFYDKPFDLGDLSNGFHIYQLEWTPYRFAWYVDGTLIHTFHRYYQKTLQIDEIPETYVCYTGLDCSDIPDNENVSVWEHIAWNRFQVFFMDLVLYLDQHPIRGNPNSSSFQIDWIKVEQRTNIELEVPNVICSYGDIAALLNASPNTNTTWDCSDGLICLPDTGLTLNLDLSFQGSGRPGWVEVNVPNADNCFGHTLHKDVWLGTPEVPSIQSVITPCNGSLTLIITNGNTEAEYEWQIQGSPPVFVSDDGKYIDISYTPLPVYQTIYYVLTYSNQCGSDSKYGWVLIPPCYQNTGHLVVSPNPANSTISIEMVNLPDYSSHPMIIIDHYFNTVKTITANYPVTTVNVSDLHSGYYFAYIAIDENQRIYSSKFLVQH
jgi:hypothetical protein